MTDAQVYADAVHARLDVEPFAGEVHDCGTPREIDRTSRWITHFVGGTPADANRLTGGQVDDDVWIIVRAVGSSVWEARAARDHGHQRLVGWRPEIDGRRCDPIVFNRTNLPPTGLGFDDTVGEGRWFFEDVFQLHTQPERNA